MPVTKGGGYGERRPVPDGMVVVGSDAEARAVLEDARRGGRPYPPLGLVGGDLCRTLGGGTGATVAGVVFPVDLGVVLADGRLFLFVASLVARGRWWGRAFVAMNAQYLGRWDAAPRAHPGDGLLDVYDVRLPPSQALAVRARLHSGTHLPHPGIRERRVPAAQVDLGRPLVLRLDGERVAKATTLSVRVQPDSLTVVV